MIKIPISFKGPKGQIQQLFSESVLYQALGLLLDARLMKWQHKPALEMINGVIADGNTSYHLNIAWPLSVDTNHVLGSCSCQLPKPCYHLAAIIIASKTKLEQLPPFTQQLQANKNMAETLSNWMRKQQYEPYPNMARHRVIYLLDYANGSQSFSLSVHKAYLSSEGRYAIKSNLDVTLLSSKTLPKFVTLADQRILQLMQNTSIATDKFELNSERDAELLHQVLLSKRCFWKACYRSPLEYNQQVNIINPDSLLLLNNFYLSVAENAVATKARIFAQPIRLDLNQGKLIAHIHISSYAICVPASVNQYFDIDIAKISFIYQHREQHRDQHKEFSFADLSSGKIMPETQLLTEMSAYLRQIENLDSVYGHYEPTVIADFHLNDRYIDQPFSQYACLLTALQDDGWRVSIDKSFRLNQKIASQWYAQITSQKINKTRNYAQHNWFDLELGINLDGQSINILPYLVKALQAGKIAENADKYFNIKLDDGTNIGLNNNKLKQIISVLSELYDSASLNADKALSLTTAQLTRINQLDASFDQANAHEKSTDNEKLSWQGDVWLQQKAQELNKITHLPKLPVPDNLHANLRPYQLTGFYWLQFLSQFGFGGILADDMGLGKTLQVLTHILSEKNQAKLTNPCLIIVPTSLLSNWQTEIQKFTPSLKCVVLTGLNRHRLYPSITSTDIVIISYGVMLRDQKLLSQYTFHLQVLDEAQAIKNAKTRAAKVAHSIKAQQRLCLSGTPIENHLGELWSLFHFLMPDFLGSQKQFQHIYQIPIEKQHNQQRNTELSQRISPFMLRRTKAKVATELPDKTEILQIITLNEAQANLYESIRLSMRDEIKQALAKSANNSSEKHSFIISNALLRLRQVCCHPALLKLDSVDDKHESAKLNWLSTVLPNMLEEGNRILLFSSFTSMLDIIQTHLQQLNIHSLKLTGKTPSAKRGALIDAFQAGEVPVFLISLKAGGYGLNLTRADTVIHFDPWWNPAAEAQASDRAHRIGQEKKVFVYKLISQGTVEEKIHSLQQQKHALAEGIFAGQNPIASILKSAQWQDFFQPLPINP